MKKKAEKFGIALVVVMVLALLLSFEKVGNFVGETIGQGAGVVSAYAKTVLVVALGLYLVTTGAAALAVPIVGIGLIVVGLVLVGYALWPYFQKKIND